VSDDTPDRRLWLWHPAGASPTDGTLIGWRDTPLLDPDGTATDARRIAGRMDGITAIYASDRRRIRKAARPLARALGLSVRVTPALREINYGDWEGSTWPAVRARDPEAYRAYMADWGTAAMPGGESFADLQSRIAGWWADVEADGPLAIVADAGALRALTSVILGWSPTDTMGVALTRGSYAIIDPSGQHGPRWNLPLG